MTQNFDIIIAGGGLIGSVAAIAMAKLGLRCALIDPAPKPKTAKAEFPFDGRAYALALTSQRLLTYLDLWPDLAAKCAPILHIKITDGRVDLGPGFGVLDFDHAEIEEGPMGYMLEDRHMRPAVYDRLSAYANITCFFSTSVQAHAIKAAHISVSLSDGATLTGKTLLACDGAESFVAKDAGFTKIRHDYRQTGLVCAIEHSIPHENTAYQYFMPQGPLALLPLTKQRMSIVWTEETAQAKDMMALPDDDYLAALAPRIGGFLGDFSLCGDRGAFPLYLHLSHHLVTERIALIGDAAHRIHPIAGQGLNAGLRDIAALAHVLHEAKGRGEDIGAIHILERYQKWRRLDNSTLAWATGGFNGLFSNNSNIMRGLRAAGLRTVANLPLMRRQFIRNAAGLSGELPDWMKP